MLNTDFDSLKIYTQSRNSIDIYNVFACKTGKRLYINISMNVIITGSMVAQHSYNGD